MNRIYLLHSLKLMCLLWRVLVVLKLHIALLLIDAVHLVDEIH